MRYTILIAVLATLSACKDADTATKSLAASDSAEASALPLATVTPTPSPSPTATPAPTRTILEDWGYSTGNAFPLNFSAMSFNTATMTLWYQYSAGNFQVSGQETRRYRADYTILGDNYSGTILISGCHIIWSIVSSEVNSTPCPSGIDGSHVYSIDSTGMTLDGNLYN